MNIYQKTTTAVCLALGIGFGAQGVQAQDAAAKKAPEAKAPVLKVGDAIPTNALEGVTWVQGDEVKSFDEKGKIYIIENWATWCGPCVAVIPHVNDLHKKYADKGLVVVGMNVWEDGLEKVQDFVKKQGDGMAYRVAYSGGRESNFTNTVLKPAGVRGIPHAMIVKDGKLMIGLHPSKIDDQMIEDVIAGTFDPIAYDKRQKEEVVRQKELRDKLQPLMQKGDWDGVKALADGLKNDERLKPMLLIKVAVEKGDWAGLQALRKDAEAGVYGSSLKVSSVDSSVVRDAKVTEGSADYAKLALADMKPLEAGAQPPAAFQHHFNKARFEFMTGNKDAASTELKAAKDAVDKIDNPRSKGMYVKIIDGAIAKVAEGSFPSISELMRMK